MKVDDADRLMRFREAVLQTRAVCYALAAAIGLVFVLLGVIEISPWRIEVQRV